VQMSGGREPDAGVGGTEVAAVTRPAAAPVDPHAEARWVRPVSPAPLGDVLFHQVCLALAAGVLALALILRVDGAGRVVVPVLDLPLPEICTAQRWFGLNCPGCGLTRSFISLAHADAASAWRFNPAGLLWFGVACAQIPYRMLQLRRLGRKQPELRVHGLFNLVLCGCVGMLVLQWGLRMLLPVAG
jgi:hypothetical protein